MHGAPRLSSISPRKKFCRELAARILRLWKEQQELCQGANDLMFLAFSSATGFSFDPPRIKPDGTTVPRRNTFQRQGRRVEGSWRIWFFLQLLYDQENCGHAKKDPTRRLNCR